MKNAILTLLVYMLALSALGQDLEIVKLQKAIKQHPQPDTVRVNLLNAMATMQYGQPEELEKLATEALHISRKTGYATGEGHALLHLSTAKLRQGDKQGAVLLVQGADSIAAKTADQELLGYVWLGKGRVYKFSTDNRQALAYLKKGEEIALKIGNKKLASICQREIASMYGNSFNNYPLAIEYGLRSVQSAEEADCLSCLSRAWFNLGANYAAVGDQNNSLMYYQKAATANKQVGDEYQDVQLNNNIGERYRLLGKYKEAIPFYNKVLDASPEPLLIEMAESNLADVYTRMDSLSLAFKYAFSSLAKAKKIDDNEGVAWIDGILSRLYLKKGMVDSAVFFSRQGLEMAKQTGTIEFMRDNAGALASAFAFNKDFENAYKYHLQYINYRDSMLNAEISNKSALLQYNYDLAKKQAQITTLDQQKKVQQNILMSALVVLLLIVITAVVLLRNNRLKQKAKVKIEEAYKELKTTQAQLVQKEKMASLGELTAGIAHEIQNPLNFINNFSEVSKELVEEIKQEIDNGNTAEAKTLANDTIVNLNKVVHHGKRADAIVKGMLQHSRSSTGKKEPTNINALAEEYLRLAYQAARTKDQSFQSELKTYFDPSIDAINVVPQDVGRVLLNLFNNALYAVCVKKHQLNGTYKPEVAVSTKKEEGKVLISIRDNGNGIPQQVLDKIFQPFFTTKPAGEGTGLGLSLSYDIITKVHGGELKVNTKEGEYAEFIVQLPA